MKGIIAEIDGKNMIVIAKNGEFIKCKKLPNLHIGDEISITRSSMTSIYKKMSAVAASFLIFAMLSTGVYAYYTPYSYVSVDINPSLELRVNRFEKVIGAHAFNVEAEKVLEATNDIKNKGIDDALEQVLNVASEQGYLKHEASNSLMIVVSSGNNKEETTLAKKVTDTSTEVLSKLSNDYEVILEKTKIDNYMKAKKNNVSPGRVILASKFKEVKPEIDEEQILRMPLQQAIKQIEKKEDKTTKPDKPKAEAVNENKKPKEQEGSKVKNVKELIIEKNEDLGKKLINQKDDKDNNKKEKDTFNNNDQGNKEKDKIENDNGNGKSEPGNNKNKEDNNQQPSQKDDKKNKN